MATPYYVPETKVPLPPKDADVISTACDYCIVACGYMVYRWPVAGGKEGGPKAEQNAFLPQVLLELEGDEIYAVGIFGLIFGRFDNLKA